MAKSSNARCEDLRKALTSGTYKNKNHYISVAPGVQKDAAWCQSCPDGLRCFLVGKSIDIREAVTKQYPCVKQQKYILFRYHGAACLVFDTDANKMNDWGYWGYSITTSRAIRWYVEALADNGFIQPNQVEPALTFFKARANNAYSGDAGLPWYHVT